jgi:hypothetical protein
LRARIQAPSNDNFQNSRGENGKRSNVLVQKFRRRRRRRRRSPPRLVLASRVPLSTPGRPRTATPFFTRHQGGREEACLDDGRARWRPEHMLRCLGETKDDRPATALFLDCWALRARSATDSVPGVAGRVSRARFGRGGLRGVDAGLESGAENHG